MKAVEIMLLIVFAVVGGAIGWAYVVLMQRSIVRITGGGLTAWKFVALALLRVALFGGGIVAAMYAGGWCIVTYALGFVLVRSYHLGTARREIMAPEGGRKITGKGS